MEACLVGANHSPPILAKNESGPVVFNCELRNVSLPREADPLGQEHPIFLTDISTNIPTEAKSEDENRVHVATLDDLPEREKRRLRHDPHSSHAGRTARIRQVPPGQGCGEPLRSCRAWRRKNGP